MESERSLNEVRSEILEGMREYMADVSADGGDPGYTEADIGRCASILDGYLSRVSGAGRNADVVMGAVKDVVLELNELNERCDSGLIETDQREQICELIILAAAAAGVGSGEDLTEEWREW